MVIKAIPTTYNGKKFRSLLEATWAEWLDQNNIKWVYEFHDIQLSDGTRYIPDFYLDEVDTFIEVKGFMDRLEKPYKLIQELKKESQNWPDNGTMVLLAGPIGTFYNIDEAYYGGFHLVKCSKCGCVSIVTRLGSYSCRACGEDNGDHDIIANITAAQKPLKWLFLERD